MECFAGFNAGTLHGIHAFEGGVLDSQREMIESRISMQKRIVPSSEERMRRPTPPQPPLIPLTVDVGYPDQQSGGYYAQNG